tara:strand:+ start:391 stop:888 length:498 start_codon:yes stop_codon:yes gene_type:complete
MAIKFDFNKMRTAVAGWLSATDSSGASLSAGEQAVYVPKLRSAKIVEKIAATVELTTEDSGKLFIVSQAGAYDITIPAVTESGWNAKFIVGTVGANDVDVIGGTADVMVGIEMADTNTAIAAASDKVTFVASNAVLGDWIEVVSDGSAYYVQHGAVADNGAAHSG